MKTLNKAIYAIIIVGLSNIISCMGLLHFDIDYNISNTICNRSQDTLHVFSTKIRSQWIIAPGDDQSYLLTYNHNTHSTPQVGWYGQQLLSDTIGIVNNLDMLICAIEFPYDTSRYPITSNLPYDKTEYLLYADTLFITDSLLALCN